MTEINKKKPTTEQEAILYFLDCSTYEEKAASMFYVREFASDFLIDTLAVAMDIVIPEGKLDDRLQELEVCINTHRRYEIYR